MKVMVVDDEIDVQALFQQQFRREIKEGKIAFHFAFSGEEALAYLAQHDTTDLVLILSDINMPGMSGIELLKRLKAKYAGIKVFMITAYSDGDNLREAELHGSEDYVTKPIDFANLKQKIFGL